jgi:hypothetical protein
MQIRFTQDYPLNSNSTKTFFMGMSLSFQEHNKFDKSPMQDKEILMERLASDNMRSLKFL